MKGEQRRWGGGERKRNNIKRRIDRQMSIQERIGDSDMQSSYK